MKLKLSLANLLILGTTSAFALPMDWTGSVGFDTNSYQNFRKTGDDCVNYTTVAGGTIDFDSCESSARFQTYVVKLQPSVIINDSATIKSELSIGSFRGGQLGDGSESFSNQDPQLNYFYNRSNGESTISANQLYAELYADVGLIRVGRFAKGFGLGAILNKGERTFDRSFSQYDGLEAEFKLGSFTATPYWGKMGVSATTPNGAQEVTEKGISVVYNNINTNLQVGLLFASRSGETKNDLYARPDDGAATVFTGASSATLIDIYAHKGWESFNLSLEIPMIKGEIENMYDQTGELDYDASAYIFEANWLASKKWTIGVNAGMVSGHDGDTSKFGAMALHPNYQVAEILYRYNYQGFVDSQYDIFQASISNSQYAKLYARWESDTWAWNLAFIMATAQETAKAGQAYYDHELGKMIANSATTDQADDLGTEFDISFDYRWNPNVTVTGYAAYLATGDYFKYNGTATEFSVESVTAMGLRLGVNF